MDKNTQTDMKAEQTTWTAVELYDSIMLEIEPLLASDAAEELQQTIDGLPVEQRESFAEYCALCVDICMNTMETVLDKVTDDMEALKKNFKGVSAEREEKEQAENVSNIEHILDDAS